MSETVETVETAERWTILVCDRGFVLAGIVRPHPTESLTLLIDKCQVVRKWGTKKGIGELAIAGPTDQTILDPEGDGVEQGKWWIYRQITCTPEASRAWTQQTYQ